MTLVLLFIGTIYGACCLIQMCHTSICISWLLIITHYSVLHVDGMPIALRTGVAWLFKQKTMYCIKKRQAT
jgi:hypothetical protein